VRQVSKTLVRLNVETRCFHAAADAPWLDLIAPGRRPTRLEYLYQLVAAYGFDAPLEAALAYTPHLEGFINLHPRFRSGMLAADLLALGLKPGEIADLRQCMIAPFASVAEAFGWLYVHERAALLFSGVCAELCARLPELEHATSTLCTHQHLDSFGEALDRVARTPAIEERIVSAAIDAFRTLQVWNRRPQAMRLTAR
jgi:heme oxygenase